ncbi:methyl-accepting chemotaxis protein [Clostridium saccharoperbutylacetonicum]|uniref:Methyl-accepting chemotaxis protein 4 n=1 Tax=Clostridium saccharoperbutylacetonicum N1-4(HMT) TaxID=931276 RepID=M1MIF8_9CLOT|nr:methyl-accepting chemotaxis protein [Clostridium saccharoperbutylacetonicum]AGF56108.1 methyl-accepting chemotaxis protein 4 [Clostridium saccharoperbutylacetonicum N1-4(HMT)]NRT63151.1 methyl-accepting chemotaxis protein [Clostridium saccharoperbutylacetonicum]NSB26511.1 methyl-accepting chemotaxis protein [Clostridium saccharoperbutylacetonicum]NSB45861.1 methyl-accepting chemotaxis protein [Clostridium saccharoperbutylacetonicum]
MFSLGNVRVRTKLIGGFIIVSLLIGLVGGLGVISLKNVGKKAEGIYSQNLRVVYILTDMQANLERVRGNMAELIYVKDQAQKDELKKSIANDKEENTNYMSEFESINISDEEKKVYEEFQKNITQYRSLRENVIKLVDEGNFEEAEKQYVPIRKVTEPMFISLDKLININVDSAKSANDNIKAINASSNMIMMALSIIGLILAILLGVILSRDINKPLQKIKMFGEKLANYDLNFDFEVTRKDEFGQTGGSLVIAQNNIKELVKTIIENSQSMSAASEELSATVEEISSKAINIDEAVNTIASNMQEASAETEEIGASIEEVDSSVIVLSQKAMEGSNNSNESKVRAKEVKDSSKKAIEESQIIFNEKKNRMLKAIEDEKVVENIKVMAGTIASIAEQTNLLALNAAIEAARAGEQGKGFAVVAEEVRTLAEQSAEAVKNIQETIEEVQKAFKNSIDTGNDILEFINTDVHKQFTEYEKTGNQYYSDADFVSTMSENIAAMSEEITATVGQVSEAMQNMAQNTQKSSEQAEEIRESVNETTQALEHVALTAQNQAELAQKLNEVIQKFNI